jgi:hypothetical protein
MDTTNLSIAYRIELIQAKRRLLEAQAQNQDQAENDDQEISQFEEEENQYQDSAIARSFNRQN